MTVPKSKVLSVSKGLMALADFKHCSPDVKQSVIVNVSSTKNEKESGVNTDTSVLRASPVLKTTLNQEMLKTLKESIVQPSIPKESEVSMIIHTQTLIQAQLKR